MFCFLHDNNELDISFISCSLTDCGYFHSALPLAWLSQSKTPVDLARPFFQNECQSNQDLLQCTVIKLDLPVFLTTCITHNNIPLLSRHQRKYWNTSSTTVFQESLNFHVHVKLWQKKSWFLETSDTVVINGTLESYDCSIYRWDWVQVNNVIPINMRNTPFSHQTNNY